MYQKRNTKKKTIKISNILHQNHGAITACEIFLGYALYLHYNNYCSADDNDVSLTMDADPFDNYDCSEKVKQICKINSISNNISCEMTA